MSAKAAIAASKRSKQRQIILARERHEQMKQYTVKLHDGSKFTQLAPGTSAGAETNELAWAFGRSNFVTGG